MEYTRRHRNFRKCAFVFLIFISMPASIWADEIPVAQLVHPTNPAELRIVDPGPAGNGYEKFNDHLKKYPQFLDYFKTLPAENQISLEKLKFLVAQVRAEADLPKPIHRFALF